MSRTAINEVLDRALLDEEFRIAVQNDPERTLDAYDLTDEERSALASRSYLDTVSLAAAPEVGPRSAVNLFLTSIVYLNTTDLIAIRLKLDEERGAELTSRGDEIVRTPGNRTEAIKELLARMR